jgi:hypothetical protein
MIAALPAPAVPALLFLQELVGGPAAFEPFMAAYLQAFAFKTVDSSQFKQLFTQHFSSNPAGAQALAEVNTRCAWLVGSWQ